MPKETSLSESQTPVTGQQEKPANEQSRNQENASGETLSFYRWFKQLKYIMIILSAAYVMLHMAVSLLSHYSARAWWKWDYEYSRLDEAQKNHIKIIYEDSMGSAQTHSINQNERAINFLISTFNEKVDTEQIKTIRTYLTGAKVKDAEDFLNNERIRVKSYFWLVGPEIYFEIIFWSLFGVACYLLYVLGYLKKSSTSPDASLQDAIPPAQDNTVAQPFDSSHVPSMQAKFLYAPACSLILILGYNYFKGESVADISSSKAIIIVAFISGFFSSRVMSFLDRLKELLLPVGDSGNVKSLTPATENNIGQKKLSGEDKPEENVREQDDAGDAKPTATISLILDDEIDEKLRNAIQKKGLDTADPVTLVPIAGGEPIVFTKTAGEAVFTFISTAVINPGQYLAQASWSGELLPESGKDASGNPQPSDPIFITLQANEQVTIDDAEEKEVSITMQQTSE